MHAAERRAREGRGESSGHSIRYSALLATPPPYFIGAGANAGCRLQARCSSGVRGGQQRLLRLLYSARALAGRTGESSCADTWHAFGTRTRLCSSCRVAVLLSSSALCVLSYKLCSRTRSQIVSSGCAVGSCPPLENGIGGTGSGYGRRLGCFLVGLSVNVNKVKRTSASRK